MKWGNWLIGACCALFVVVIVTPTGVYEGVWKLATGKDAAAWVQAIGSVAAILAAVAIAAYQNSREEWRRQQAIRTAMFIRNQAAMWISDLALTAVRFVPETLENEKQIPALLEFGFPKHTFEEAVAAIEGLPLHEYEVPQVAVALTLLKTLVRGAEQRADLIVARLRQDEEISKEIWLDLRQRVVDARKQRDFIHALGNPMEVVV